MVYLKKNLGQHFLVDNAVLESIKQAIDVLENKEILIEVGPGMGALTKYIMDLKFGDYFLIEKDDRFVEELPRLFPTLKNNIIHTDVLDFSLTQFNSNQLTIVGNYPYNISNQIIFWILEQREVVLQSVGMFQKEVGMRIASSHGTKDYGILSVLTQAFYDVEYLFDIAPESFDPPPRVVSGVIKMTKMEHPKADFEPLKKVVKMAFNQRRKMLRNSMKSALWKDSELYESLSTLRPEQISVEQFCELSKFIE